MLILYDINHNKVEGLTNYKDLKIDKEINVEDTLSFLFPVSDLKHDAIQEECYIRTEENEYIIKEVNYSDDDWTEYICKINIEDLKGKEVTHFETIAQECTDAINLALVGTGWTIASCDVTKLRTVRKNNCTAYNVLQEIQSAYGCEMIFDSVNKQVYIYQVLGTDRGAYFAEQLNLKTLGVQRNSYDYITRLIPIGKDGLGIESVNGGLSYISNNQYSNKIITSFWEDNRYTDAQSLKDDAVTRLAYLSKPYKSYSADILDLSSISVIYSILDYSLGDTITLLAKSKNTKEKQRIIKFTQYLDEPERNSCEIANKIVSLDALQVRFDDTSDVVDMVTTSDGLVDGTKIDEVDWDLIANINIITANIQDAAIVEAKIGNLAVTTAKIALLAVDSAQIKDAAIINAKIGLLAVDTAQIKDAAIINAKIGLLAVDTAQIVNAAITTAKIANLAVDSAKIALLAVGTAQIALGAITTALLGTAAVDTAQIKDGSITDAKIVSLTANKISAGTIDAAIITVTHLNAANITVGTINGVQIAAGAIDVTKLTSGLANSITSAQSTADGKNTSYYQTTVPTGGVYKVNDIWFDTDDNYKMYFWNGTVWTAAQFGATALSSGVNTSISTAQSTANTAISDALTAHNLADSAQGTANTAKAYTDNLANDSVITPDEKLTLKPKWDEIVAEGFPALPNLLINSDFSNGTTGWINSGLITFSVASNIISCLANSQNDRFYQILADPTALRSHKMYSSCWLKTTSTSVVFRFGDDYGYDGATTIGDNIFHFVSLIHTINPLSGTNLVYIRDTRAAGWDAFYAKYFITIDLTAIFGAGNEPTAAQFEAMKTSFNLIDKSTVTAGYYVRYDNGTLVPQAEWNVSDWNSVIPNAVYRAFHTDQNYAQFDQNKTYISTVLGSPSSDFTFTTAPNCKYVRFSMPDGNLNSARLDLIWFDGTYAYGKIPAQALSFGVDDSAFDTKFAILHTYLIQTLDLFTAMTTAETGLVRATWDLTWNDYYLARTDLLNAIAAKAKTLADTAQIRADLGVADALVAHNLADSAQGTANTAQSTANGKNKVYYQIATPTGGTYIIGDIWFDTDDSYKMYVHNGTTFTASQFGTNAIANLAITNALIADATILNAKISTVDAGKITTGYLAAARLAAGTITAASGIIADAAITTAKIALLAVTNALIADATIASAKIAALDAGKITTGYLAAARIQAGSIVTAAIAAGNITATLLATDSVTAIKIAAATITGDKLVADTITAREIAVATITANEIAALTITAAQIAAGTITAAKMTAGTITAASGIIADAAITTAKIGLLQVTAALIADATITSAKIANATIVNANIADATIQSAKIVELDAAKITTGYLAAARINANTITSEKLNVLAKNLVNNYSQSESLEGWTNFGLLSYSSIKTSKFHNVPTVGNTMIASNIFDVDPNKTYKVALSVLAQAAMGCADGIRYFGLYAYDVNNAPIPVTPYTLSTKTWEANSNNFYFEILYGAIESWRDMECYICGYNVLASEIPVSKNVGMICKMLPNTKHIILRYLNYGTAGVTRSAYFWGPSVTEISAGSIQAESISTGYLDAARLAAGSITADKINVTNLYAERISYPGSPTSSWGLMGTIGGKIGLQLFNHAVSDSVPFYGIACGSGAASDPMVHFEYLGTEIASFSNAQGWVFGDAVVARLRIEAAGGFVVRDTVRNRMVFAVNGSFEVWDCNNNPVIWEDATVGFIQMHAPTLGVDNALGVDLTGAYKITAGVKTYL